MARLLAALALVPALVHAASTLSDDDRATLALRDHAGAVEARAISRAGELGREENLAALDYLAPSDQLDSAQLQLLHSFAYGFHGAPTGTVAAHKIVEVKLVAAWDRANYVALLADAVRKVDDERLWDLMYADVEGLAKLRADQRRRCRIEVVTMKRVARPGQSGAYGAVGLGGPRPGGERLKTYTEMGPGITTSIEWKYACKGPAPEDKLAARTLTSLYAIAQTDLPDAGKRLSPLLVDLSLPVPASWSAVGARPAGFFFPPALTPVAILDLLKARNASPGANAIASILALYEEDTFTSYRRDSSRIRSLVDLAATDRTHEGNEIVAHWLPAAAVAAPFQDRRSVVGNMLRPLAYAYPPEQVDLAALRNSVLGRLTPREDSREIARLFDEAVEDNRSLREPTADSLSRWLGRNDLEHVRWLLDHGADPSGPVSGGQAPLFAAIRRGPVAVRTLLDAGADAKSRDGNGIPALLFAASAGDLSDHDRVEMLKLLLGRGASVQVTAETGATPLYPAVHCPDCVRLLLSAGAQVDAADRAGHAALFSAVVADNEESAGILLEAGADPNKDDSGGRSPYMHALERGRKPLIALLERHGARLTPRQLGRRAADRTDNLLRGLLQ